MGKSSVGSGEWSSSSHSRALLCLNFLLRETNQLEPTLEGPSEVK